ncbi:MAG TPA: hypothetical protein VG737_16345 [Cyclobacteriaceae bacterium]|nr:hypothetical protein [Cyclobacteriaceae bacterium]
MPLAEDQLTKYVQWAREGRSFSEIRKDLKDQGYAEDIIKSYITEIDDAAIQQAADGLTGSRRINFITVGIVIIIIGLILLVVGLYAERLYVGVAVTLSVGLGFIIAGLRLKRGSRLAIQKPGRRRFNLKH